MTSWRQLSPLGRLGVLVSLVVLGAVLALQWQITRLNRSVDRVGDATADVQSYVDDLRTQTPAEAERAAQIAAVLAAVPAIQRDTARNSTILCEAFPGASTCLAPAEGGP